MGCVTGPAQGLLGGRNREGLVAWGQSHLLPPLYFLATHSSPPPWLPASGGTSPSVGPLPFPLPRQDWAGNILASAHSSGRPQESYLPAPSLWHQLMTWSWEQAVCSAPSTSFISHHCYHTWVQTLSYIGLAENHFTDKETEIQRHPNDLSIVTQLGYPMPGLSDIRVQKQETDRMTYFRHTLDPSILLSGGI